MKPVPQLEISDFLEGYASCLLDHNCGGFMSISALSSIFVPTLASGRATSSSHVYSLHICFPRVLRTQDMSLSL